MKVTSLFLATLCFSFNVNIFAMESKEDGKATSLENIAKEFNQKTATEYVSQSDNENFEKSTKHLISLSKDLDNKKGEEDNEKNQILQYEKFLNSSANKNPFGQFFHIQKKSLSFDSIEQEKTINETPLNLNTISESHNVLVNYKTRQWKESDNLYKINFFQQSADSRFYPNKINFFQQSADSRFYPNKINFFQQSADSRFYPNNNTNSKNNNDIESLLNNLTKIKSLKSTKRVVIPSFKKGGKNKQKNSKSNVVVYVVNIPPSVTFIDELCVFDNEQKVPHLTENAVASIKQYLLSKGTRKPDLSGICTIAESKNGIFISKLRPNKENCSDIYKIVELPEVSYFYYSALTLGVPNKRLYSIWSGFHLNYVLKSGYFEQLTGELIRVGFDVFPSQCYQKGKYQNSIFFADKKNKTPINEFFL